MSMVLVVVESQSTWRELTQTEGEREAAIPSRCVATAAPIAVPPCRPRFEITNTKMCHSLRQM